MTARDQGSRAFGRALTIALGLLTLVSGTAALLMPLGVFAHLHGMLTQLCVTATHIISDIAALSLVLLAGSTLTVAALSVAARRCSDAPCGTGYRWTAQSGVG